MGKKDTPKRGRPRVKPPKKSPPAEFTEDEPPVMNAVQLGKKYGVTDENIRVWAKLPGWCKQVRHGAWKVADFDRCKKLMDQQGGPAGFKRWIEENVPEAERRGEAKGVLDAAEAAAAKEDQAGVDSSEATTSSELMKLPKGSLIKAKVAEEVATKRLANQERRRSLIRRSVVEEVIAARGQYLKGEAKKLELELPPKLVGLDRPEIEKKLAEAFQEFFARAAEFGAPIVAPAVPSTPETATGEEGHADPPG